MNHLFILTFLFLFDFSLCSAYSNKEFRINIIRQTASLASYETATILCNNTRVYYLQENKNNYYYRKTISLQRYSRKWYSLVLRSTHDFSWYPGSWIAIQGEYGNTFVKEYLWQSFNTVYQFYPGYLISQDDHWRFQNSLYSGLEWTALMYNDSFWDQRPFSHSSLQSTTGFSLRHIFQGLVDLNVITLSVSYKCGIIVYLQQQEIYRDHVTDGPITESTTATACYASTITRTFTQACYNCSESSNILAIALFAKDTPLFMNETRVWLAPQGTILKSHSSLDTCHVLHSEYSITGTAPESQHVMDFNYLTTLNAELTSPVTVILHSSEYAVLNGLMFMNLNHSLLLPLVFSIYGKHTTEWELIGRSYQGIQEFSDKTVGLFPMNRQLYHAYKIVIASSRSMLLELTEIRLLSCNLKELITFELNIHTVNVTMFVDGVEVFPIYDGFTTCSVEPALPVGLFLDSSTCAITGRTETEFEQTFTLIGVNGMKEFQTEFTLRSSRCQGTVVLIDRNYGEAPSLEIFTIQNRITNEIVYDEPSNSFQHAHYLRHIRLCLPSSHFAIHMDHENNRMWHCSSFLSVSLLLTTNTTILIAKSRYDTLIGLDSTLYFSTLLVIQPHAEWSYYTGSIPFPLWMSQPTHEWPVKTTDVIPPASLQLFHKTFEIPSAASNYTYQLYLQVKAGCIVYVNGIEVFRRYVADPALTNATKETGWYDEMIYRVISFPQCSFQNQTVRPIVHEGTNWIAIGLVNKLIMPPMSFDCVLRMDLRHKQLLTFDYDVQVEGYDTDVTPLFDLCSATSFTFNGSDLNSLIIQFTNDRREWVSMFDILVNASIRKEPTSLIVEAKNPEDETWTMLSSHADWYWWTRGMYKTIYLPHNKPYNQFRFRNIVSKDHTWSLTSLLLYQQGLESYDPPSLTYHTIQGYEGYPITDYYPSTPLYSHYSSLTPLPQGLHLDPGIGVISGTPMGVFNGTIQIHATFLNMINLTTSVQITISHCVLDNSIIYIHVFSESYSNNEHLSLYQGRETSKLLWEFTCPSSSQFDYVFTFCLHPALYTFVAKSIDEKGWLFPAGYSISIQEEQNVVSINHVRDASGYARSVFTALNPFPSYTYCSYIVDKEVPSHWIMTYFDDSAWLFGPLSSLSTSVRSTMYVRYQFTIPSFFDYRILGVTVHYSTCFAAYFNGNRVARVGLPNSIPFAATCSTSSSIQTMSFYILLYEMGGLMDKNTLAIEVHQTSNKKDIVFQISGYFGVDDVNEMYNLIDVDQVTNPLLDSDIQTYLQVDGKIGNKFDLVIKNEEGQPFNSISYFCDQSIPKYALQLFAKSPFPSQTPHPHLQDGMELLLQDEIQGLQDRWKNVLPIPFAMGPFHHFRIIDMYYDLEKMNLLFSGILPSYTFKNGSCRCPSMQNFQSVKCGEVAPGPCPVNQTGIATRFCANGEFGDVDYSHCLLIPPANLTYSSTTYLFYLGIPASTGIPTYHYIIDLFTVETLPPGLSIDSATGEIAGIPTGITELQNYSIVGQNKDGDAIVEISIEVSQLFCINEIDQSFLPLFDEEWIACDVYDRGVGRIRRQCVYRNNTPTLQMSFFCITFSPFVITCIILFCFVCIFILKEIYKKVLINRILHMSRVLYSAPV